MPVTCCLLVPSLFIEPLQGDEYHCLHAPALQTLLGRADIRPLSETSSFAWLNRAFGGTKSLDIPVAPITLVADGHDAQDNYWLRADPVHLRIQRDQIVLFDAHAVPLDQAEANALCDTLNQHFIADGWRFLAAAPDRWYIALQAAPGLETVPLDQACGNAIGPLMPAGPDSATWRRRMNEVQMLLNDHPINLARESRGELAINSVWFWGGGMMPANPQCDFTDLMSNDIFAQGLARAAKLNVQTLAENPRAQLQSLADAEFDGRKILFIINWLYDSMRYGDLTSWRKAHERLEAEWFSPLLAAIKSGALDSFTIIDPNAYRAREFVVTRSSMRKFWLRAKQLKAYA
ncbi:MAG: hypothetical protein WCB36_01625 [Burkholderiales bacterium]